MMGVLRQLARARGGAAAMELVFITPVVSGLFFGALDFSNAWAMRLSLEKAAQTGIEAASARGVAPGGFAFALTEATNAWGQPTTSATVDDWLECDGVRQANLTDNCNGTQRARYVGIRLQAIYTPFFSFGGLITGDAPDGGYYVTGDATVRLL